MYVCIYVFMYVPLLCCVVAPSCRRASSPPMCVPFSPLSVGDEAADNSVDPKFLDADKAIVAKVKAQRWH